MDKRNRFRWDERHRIPHTDMSKWEKLWESKSDLLIFMDMGLQALLSLPAIFFQFFKKTIKPFSKPVKIEHQFGIAITPSKENENRILSSLSKLGIKNLLIRLYCWDRNYLGYIREFCKCLNESGYNLTFALIQDRQSVVEKKRWAEFLEFVFENFHSFSSFMEIGHCPNRKKWGIWNYKEYLKLLEVAILIREKFPDIKLIGPAVIDFEVYFINSILKHDLARELDIISSLLYVDRRGAPENRQLGLFDLVQKLKMIKAIIFSAFSSDKPLWITEFNWPLAGYGPFAPAGRDVVVDEITVAKYMLRYYLLSICSGLVERAFWWELAAPGYGLVDNSSDNWRERLSFYSLARLLFFIKGLEFIRYLRLDNIFTLFLRNSDGGDVFIIWNSDNNPADVNFFKEEEFYNREIVGEWLITGEKIQGKFKNIAIKDEPFIGTFSK